MAYSTKTLKTDLAAMLSGVSHVSAPPTADNWNALIDALKAGAPTPAPSAMPTPVPTPAPPPTPTPTPAPIVLALPALSKLSDPVLAPIGATGALPNRQTIPAASWVPTTSTTLFAGYGNRQFTAYTTDDATRIWAISQPDAKTLRFEVRHGDINPDDRRAEGTAKERSELACNTRFPRGRPIHISYDLTFRVGLPSTSLWEVVGQMHQDGVTVPPPFALSVVNGNQLQVAIRSGGTPADEYPIVGTIGLNQTVRVDVFFLGGTDGHVVVFLNGVKVLDRSGRAIGMPNGGDFYWKQGIYRHTATETAVVEYHDLRISSGAMVTWTAATLPAPTIGWADGKVTGTAPAGVNLTLFDNSDVLAGPFTVGSDGTFSVTAPVVAGVHIVTATYPGSALSNEIVLAASTPSDLLPQLDALSSVTDLVQVTLLGGERRFGVPATSTPSDTAARYSAALSKIVGGFDGFVKYAATNAVNRRADYYSPAGAGQSPSKTVALYSANLRAVTLGVVAGNPTHLTNMLYVDGLSVGPASAGTLDLTSAAAAGRKTVEIKLAADDGTTTLTGSSGVVNLA